jgi:membrane-associated HD superfamily phosphohydrolase
VYLHYLDTKRWFVFFEAQKLWNNRLRWPVFPLKNWGGSFPTHYEAVVFLLALVAIVYLLWIVRRREVLPAREWAPVLFSLAYIAGITVVTLATKGGELVSLSRYVLATPYFLLLTAWVLQTQQISTRLMLWAFLGMELCWLLFFGAYNHIQSLLIYSALSLYLLLAVAVIHALPRVRAGAFGVLVLLNSGLLILLLYRFLQNQWVA